MIKPTQPRFWIFGLLTVLVAGCATNPATGGRMLSLISESQEIEMGREYSQQIAATMPMYDDPSVQAYVERIGLDLAARSERPNLPWSFKVVDDAAVNAFALPGGFIYVTRGIMTYFNSEAELAAVVGHEIGHVTARHSVSQMSRQQLFGGLLGLGSVLSEEVRNLSGLGATAIGILGLSYSRGDEHQADLLGVRYALRGGYDPREAIHVHEMLGRQTEMAGGRGVPNWLATHPSSADRIVRLHAQVDTISRATLDGTRVGRDELLAAIDGMVYGPDPRQGFFQGARFVHPDLEFEITMPGGWKTANLTDAVVAQSPDEDAIIQMSLDDVTGHAAAARAFFSKDGVRSRGGTATSVHGNPATIGTFEAATQGGSVSGVAAFIDYGGLTYRILGYTAPKSLDAYDNAFRTTVSSFDRLTDPAALAVKPLRIQVLELQRATTLADLSAGGPATVSLEEIAILNGVDADAALEPGQKVKRVVGKPPPGVP